jgi:hypothetical protein
VVQYKTHVPPVIVTLLVSRTFQIYIKEDKEAKKDKKKKVKEVTHERKLVNEKGAKR